MYHVLIITSHDGNANQNQDKYHLTPIRPLFFKKEISSIGEDVGETGPTAAGNVQWLGHCGKL